MSEEKTHSPFLPLSIALSVCIGILIGFSVSTYQFASDEVQVSAKKFRSIFHLIDKEYVDSIDIQTFFEQSITQTLSNLDPHSSYVPSRDLATKSKLDSEISGIGIKYTYLRDTLFITEVIAGGPASKSGVLAGDRILAIEDSSIIAVKDQNVFANLLRGEKESKVNITVYRKFKNETLQIKITRNGIPFEAVDLAYMITKTTGYIKLNRFSENSGNELHKQLITLKKQGLKQLILDLRDNGGGYYDAAVQICDDFLPKDRDIVYTVAKGVVKDKKKSEIIGEFEHYPLILLINENTASAAEIVSGALKDNDRAVIVGRRSFGKALVQTPYTLFDGSEIRLTTARYYTASGRCIQKPYNVGNNYKIDLNDRLKSGELGNENNMLKNDTLKYHTLNGRTVYGGGGIYPDVFVPADTSLNHPQLAKMLNEYTFLEFGLLYSYRDTLIAQQSLEKFTEKFSVSNELLEEYLEFCKIYAIVLSKKERVQLTQVLKRELKIYLAEAIWGTNGMYRLLNINDPFIIQALKTFPKNQEILNPTPPLSIN